MTEETHHIVQTVQSEVADIETAAPAYRSAALDALELKVLRNVAREVEKVLAFFGDDYSSHLETLSQHMNAWSVIEAYQNYLRSTDE
jgi:hypothetical protein